MKTPTRVACLLAASFIFSIALILGLSRAALASAPQITAITLTSGGAPVTVTSGYYIVVPTQGWGPTGTTALFIVSNASSCDTTTAAPPTLGSVTYANGASAMFGSTSAFGMMLLNFQTAADLQSMGSNLPTNANTNMFGASGPVNKSRLSLSSALPSGTTVKFTLNMKGEVPHLVNVMGGTFPTITYDTSLNAGQGGMTIQTTTFDTTTNASDSLTGMAGFMIMSNSGLGASPTMICVQTNAWVGDIFPMMPGFDTNSAKGLGSSGTQGTASAKCGSTVYGISGQQRSTNIFVPDSILSTFFSPTATSSNLSAQVSGSTPSGGSTITATSNFSGKAGTRFQFNYTFGSPQDVTVGISSAASSATPSSSSGGCFLAEARKSGKGMGWRELTVLVCLCAVVGVLAWRRKRTA